MGGWMRPRWSCQLRVEPFFGFSGVGRLPSMKWKMLRIGCLAGILGPAYRITARIRSRISRLITFLALPLLDFGGQWAKCSKSNCHHGIGTQQRTTGEFVAALHALKVVSDEIVFDTASSERGFL